MNERHLPLSNARFWAALCLASIFGANLGDFFAHNIGLGHVAGLPFLAAGRQWRSLKPDSRICLFILLIWPALCRGTGFPRSAVCSIDQT